MSTVSEPEFEPAPSEFERRLAEIDVALAAMPAPAPSTDRQLVIARREAIKTKTRAYGPGGLEKVYRVLGLAIAFSTFKDYIYNGEASREAKGAEVARKARPPRKTAVRTEEAQLVTDIVTESTANGGPVRARKMT